MEVFHSFYLHNHRTQQTQVLSSPDPLFHPPPYRFHLPFHPIFPQPSANTPTPTHMYSLSDCLPEAVRRDPCESAGICRYVITSGKILKGCIGVCPIPWFLGDIKLLVCCMTADITALNLHRGTACGGCSCCFLSSSDQTAGVHTFHIECRCAVGQEIFPFAVPIRPPAVPFKARIRYLLSSSSFRSAAFSVLLPSLSRK